ncbi:MAG TPA: alpha/beta hydrolase [Anaerolineae bacterium]
MPFAEIGNDRIYYAEHGRAADARRDQPLVFVHGAAGSHLVWGRQVRALGEITHAVAIDLPGHGRSTLPGRNSIEEYGDVVLGLLDALGFERAVIVGHSMGGAIAQTLALAHPDRVAGLGLVGTGARLRVLPTIIDGVQNDLARTAQLVVEHSYAPTLSAAARERAEAEFVSCPASVTHGDFTACNQFDLMPRLSDIHVPTVIICGREDRMTPVKYSEFLASKITHARLTLVDGAGHSVMIENPAAVNQALIDFMRTL